MSSTAVQYHFVSKTASNLNICIVLHLAFAVLKSLYDCDVSAAIAIMGLIAVLTYSVGLLFLYMLFAPATIIVDIVRMKSVHIHYNKTAAGFFIFLSIVQILLKLVATYFGYQVYRQASEGDSGYEQISGPVPPAKPSGMQPRQTHPFPPASYEAPSQSSGGPVLHPTSV